MVISIALSFALAFSLPTSSLSTFFAFFRGRTILLVSARKGRGAPKVVITPALRPGHRRQQQDVACRSPWAPERRRCALPFACCCPLLYCACPGKSPGLCFHWCRWTVDEKKLCAHRRDRFGVVEFYVPFWAGTPSVSWRPTRQAAQRRRRRSLAIAWDPRERVVRVCSASVLALSFRHR